MTNNVVPINHRKSTDDGDSSSRYIVSVDEQGDLNCTASDGSLLELSDSQQEKYSFPTKTMTAGYLGTGAQCFAIVIATAHLKREPTEREWYRVLYSFVRHWPGNKNNFSLPGVFTGAEIAVALGRPCEMDERYP